MDLVVGRDVVRRWPENPLLSIEDVPFRCSDVWNAGVVPFPQGYLLLLTVESLRGQTMIYRAVSQDGRHFTVDPEPFLTPAESGPWRDYENAGVRDARITLLDDKYYVVYLAESDRGWRVGLARTDDFQTVERLGMVTQPDTKGGALFPAKFGGRYALLERPDPGMSIWISYSDDLEFWGASTVVMTPRGGYWDSDRIGTGAPPIRIPEGWLLLYYGEKLTSAGPLTRLGAAILDADNPSEVVARSNIPILAPREPYERIGDVPNMVFSCGAVLIDDVLHIYYGASDSCICLGTARLRDVVGACLASRMEF